MFAVVEIGDKQFLVKEGDIFTIDGSYKEKKINFDKVLFVKNDKSTKVGQPYVKSASVSFNILETGKRQKDIVFKFKRKTGQKLTRGHRQNTTVLKVEKINIGE